MTLSKNISREKLNKALKERMISTSKEMDIELFMYCIGRNNAYATLLIDIVNGEFDADG